MIKAHDLHPIDWREWTYYPKQTWKQWVERYGKYCKGFRYVGVDSVPFTDEGKTEDLTRLNQ